MKPGSAADSTSPTRRTALSRSESARFLDDLVERACEPSSGRVYAQKWAVGDLVIWDQRCVLHRLRPFDPAQPRRMRGTRVQGDPQFDAGLPVQPGEAKKILDAELQQLRENPVWEKEDRPHAPR